MSPYARKRHQQNISEQRERRAYARYYQPMTEQEFLAEEVKARKFEHDCAKAQGMLCLMMFVWAIAFGLMVIL